MALGDILAKVRTHHADGNERLQSVKAKVLGLTADSGQLERVLDRLRSDLSTYKENIKTLVRKTHFALDLLLNP